MANEVKDPEEIDRLRRLGLEITSKEFMRLQRHQRFEFYELIDEAQGFKGIEKVFSVVDDVSPEPAVLFLCNSEFGIIRARLTRAELNEEFEALRRPPLLPWIAKAVTARRDDILYRRY